MKKLIIALSNRHGCSVELTKQISKNLDCENIILRDKNVRNCVGCLTCHDKPECALKDDMQEVYGKLKQSDLLVFITPNYFGNLSGFAKNFFDRLHPFYKFPNLENKKVVFVFVGGGDAEVTLEEMTDSVRGVIKYLRFNNIKNFALKALNTSDLKSCSDEINKITAELKNI